ncbi:polysaccharide deacetylase family protein [Paenibacillus thermoaerophilus]|uniref:Polysaccharide deacetylase family protein n=1 Tax=Paenibacillus thermoaerophilus TaxID=1215385 RepID=A0ABW2V0Y4_9BACL|nr:polysaccharide deacetylase family protein [Paenibacillus thermoaerophilus]
MRTLRTRRAGHRGMAALQVMSLAATLTAMGIVGGVWIKFGPLAKDGSMGDRQAYVQEATLALNKPGSGGGEPTWAGGGDGQEPAGEAAGLSSEETPAPSPAPSPEPSPTPSPPEAPSQAPTIVPVSEAAVSGSRQGTDAGTPAKQSGKAVALTFDDGPDKRYTTAVLDILKERGVKATFYLVGSNVEKYPDVVKRIGEEGHELGNHSWAHRDLRKMTADEIAADLERTNEAVFAAAGKRPATVRAPYGAVNPDVREAAARIGLPLAGWNVDPRDWDGATAEQMMQTIKKQLRPKANILMHSFGGRKGDLSETIELLPKLIDYLKEQGYAFVYASELDI